MSRRLRLAGLLGLLSLLLLVPFPVLAQSTTSAEDSILTQISIYAGVAMTVMNVLLWFVFYALEFLLDPNLIFSSGMQDMLHLIWQFSRDIVNVIFAVLLIVGAIYTVVTAKTEMVKSKMSHFVLAVVLVNFSWFIPRVIFDVSQLTANTVFQLPSLVGAPACQTVVNGAAQPCEFVQKVLFFGSTKGVVDGMPGIGGLWHCPLPGLVCYNSTPFTPDLPPQVQVIHGLIVNHMRLTALAKVPFIPSNPGASPVASASLRFGSWLTFLIRLLILLGFNAAVAFPLIAMAIMFFVRIPVLWLTVAFMPLTALHYVLPAGIFKEFDPNEYIWKKFLNAVFLPTYVAVPFAVGYIMLNGAATIAAPAAFDNLNVPLSLLDGVQNFWQLLWMLLAFFIIWTGVFTVLKSAKITEGAVKAVTAVEGMGKSAMKLPLAAPIIPNPFGGGALTPLQLGKALDLRNAIGSDGKYHSLAERMTGPSQAALDRTSKIVTSSDAIVNVRGHFTKIASVSQADGNRELTEALRKLKASNKGTELQSISDDVLIPAIVRALNITDAKHLQKINDARKSPSGSGTGGTP